MHICVSEQLQQIRHGRTMPGYCRKVFGGTAAGNEEGTHPDLTQYIEYTGIPSTSTGKLASLRLPLVFDPGERWQYGISLDWVGRTVEAVSGQPLAVYFREHIFAPLGMTDTCYAISSEQLFRLVSTHQRIPDGSLKPMSVPDPPWREFWSDSGYLKSTGRDFLGFLRMLLHQGRFNGVRLLQPETVALMGRTRSAILRPGSSRSLGGRRQ